MSTPSTPTVERFKADNNALMAEVNLLTHKVITCGVAASHPDPNLTRQGAYVEKWDSPQADAVRKLRADYLTLSADCERLRAENARLTETIEQQAETLWRAGTEISAVELNLKGAEREIERLKFELRALLRSEKETT